MSAYRSPYKRPLQKSTMQLERQCAEWNERYPVGTAVKYYPVMGLPEDQARPTATRSAAYVLSGHTAVVFLEGVSGCVALDHCAPVKAEGKQ